MSKKTLLTACTMATVGVLGIAAVKVEHRRRRNDGHYLMRSALRQSLRKAGGMHNAAALTGDEMLINANAHVFRYHLNCDERNRANPPGLVARYVIKAKFGGRFLAEAFDNLLTPPEMREKSELFWR